MSKQVKEQPVANQAAAEQPKNLYVSVKTFCNEGKTVGERIVDLFHYGTAAWLQKHTWWAMHQGHTVEQTVATDEEIGSYLFTQSQALQAKFAKEPAAVAA